MIEKAKIEINSDELTTILYCISSKKQIIEERVAEHQAGIESGDYSTNYEPGWTDYAKKRIEEHKEEIEELRNLHDEIISRFVKGMTREDKRC